MMQLKTERLIIRPLLASDWVFIKEISKDFGKSKYAIYDLPLPTKEEELKPLCEIFASSGLWFAVVIDDKMIGYICFHELNENYDIGFCFHSAYHGKGYAYESCRALIDYLKEKKGVKKFTAGTALKNIPSRKLLKKLDFKLTEIEQVLSFSKDCDGNNIYFEGGIFENITI